MNGSIDLRKLNTNLDLPEKQLFGLTNKTYSLCEAVADIMQVIESAKFETEDSRRKIMVCIQWATQFEKHYAGVVWGAEIDYMEEVEKFTLEKIRSYTQS